MKLEMEQKMYLKTREKQKRKMNKGKIRQINQI